MEIRRVCELNNSKKCFNAPDNEVKTNSISIVCPFSLSHTKTFIKRIFARKQHNILLTMRVS